MNPQIQYLNMLRDRNVISERDYLFRLDAAYRTNPVAFKDEDVNFIENKFKKYDIDFEPAPPPGEQSVGSILNQAVSGIAEGFTTLGWADDPDTTGERLAKNIGHLIGFAPDIIAGVLTSGASLTATSAKLAGKVGLRKAGQRLATSSVKMSGAGRAYQKQLGDMAQKLTIGNFNLSKNVGGQTLLRSLPLRAADWLIDTAKGKLGQNNLMAAGFFNKGVLGNKKFREITEQGLHLGAALGVSAWKQGPQGIYEAAVHGTIAGGVFGGIAQYVDIAKLLRNPATKKLGEEAVRKTVTRMSPEQLAAINTVVRGSLGASYTGVQAQRADLPMPEVVYEYLLGFFFGASGTRSGEVKRQNLIFTKDFKSKIKNFDNLETVDRAVKKSKTWKELEPVDKKWWENFKERLYEDQIRQMKSARDATSLRIMQEVIDSEASLETNKKNLKDFYKKQMQEEDVVNSGLNQKDVKTVVKQTLDLKQELAAEKKKQTVSIINDQFNVKLSETDVLKVKIIEKDIVDTVDLAHGYNDLINVIYKQGGMSRQQIQQLLRQSVQKSNYDFEAFKKRIDPVFGKGTVKKYGQEIKRYFYRRKVHGNHRELMMIDEFNNPVPIGIENKNGKTIGRDTSKMGDNLEVPQSKSKFNRWLGDTGRKVIQYLEKQRWFFNAEKQKFEPMGVWDLMQPLDIKFGQARLAKMNEYGERTIPDAIETILGKVNKKLGANWYVHGANKDQGTLIVQKHSVKPQQVKGVLEVAKEYGIEPEGGKYKREVASNIIWDLRLNGLLKETWSKNDIRTAMDVFTNPKNGFTTNLVKWNKYQPLTQGMDLPLEAKDFVSILSDVTKIGKYNYSKTQGFEVSTKGDNLGKQFSALNARLKEGRTIEEAYQQAKGTGKGQPAKDPNFDYYGTYKSLWQQWAKENPGKIKELKDYLDKNNITTLRDRFATTENRQDRALSEILNEQTTSEGVQGFFNVMAAKDGPISKDVLKRFPDFKGNTATDGVLYIRNDVMNKILDVFGFNSNLGFVKPVGWVAPRNGKGNILLKVGGFRPSNRLNKYMVDNDIHMIAFKTGVKTQGNVKFADLDYNAKTKQWETSTQPDILKVMPEEIGINIDVYEKPKNRNMKVMKGMLDKNTSIQFSPEYFEVIDKLRSNARKGTLEMNNKAQLAIIDGKRVDKFDIDQTSLKLISDVVKNHLDKPIAKQVFEQLFERGRMEEYRVFESYEIEAGRDFIQTGLITDMLRKSDTAFSFYTNPRFQPYIQKTLRNYMAARVVRFNVDYGFEAKLYGYDREVSQRYNIQNDEFMLPNGHKKDPIQVEGEKKSMTLEDVYNEYQGLKNKKTSTLTEKDLQRYDALEEALTYVIARAPISGNGGVRVLRFAGFVNRKGHGIFTNEYNDYYLGGADKDADAVHAYQSIDKTIKKEFAKPEIQKELEKKNKFINIKSKQIGKDIYGVKTGTEYTLSDLYNPAKRLEVGYYAHQGKLQMGEIVNGGVDLINLHGIIKNNGQRIQISERDFQGAAHLKTKSTLKELTEDVYNGINWMADSAEISKVSSAGESLTKLFNKHFDIIRRDGSVRGPVGNYYDLFSTNAVGTTGIKGYDGLIAYKNFRRSLFGYKVEADLLDISFHAERFLDWYGTNQGASKSFLESLAKQYVDIDLQIEPFKYYNKKDIIQMVRKMSLDIASNPLVKQFDMTNTYRLMLSPKELEKRFLIKFTEEGVPSNYSDANLYKAAQDVVAFKLSLKKSEDMIRLLTKSGMSVDKATELVKDIAQKNYMIRQDTFENNTMLKEAGSDYNINKFIYIHKRQILNSIEKSIGKGRKLSKNFNKQFDDLYNYWLMTFEGFDIPNYKSRQKFAKKDAKELQKLIDEANKIVSELGDRVTTDRLEDLYRFIEAKRNRYSGRVININQSPLISGSSIKSFYKELDTVFEMSKNIKSDATPEAIQAGKELRRTIEKDAKDKTNERLEVLEDFAKELPTIEGHKIDFETFKREVLKSSKTNPVDLEFMNTLDIIQSKPGYIDYLGNMFLEFQNQFLMKPGTPKEMALDDLRLFNVYLKDMLVQKGSIFDRINKSKELSGPKGRHHIFFFGSAEKAMRSEIRGRVKEVTVLDKDGNPTQKSLKVPTTTLSKNLEASRFFHRLDNRINEELKSRMQEELNFLNKDDINIERGDYDVIWSGVVFEKNMRQYGIREKVNNGQQLNEAETYVLQEYKATQKILDRLKNENTIYELKEKDTKNKFKKITVDELYKRTDKLITDILTQAKNEVIQSKFPRLRELLVEAGKKVDEYKPKEQVLKSEKLYEVHELDKLFLDKNGMFTDMTKVDVLYKKIFELETVDPLNVFQNMFSLTDARYIEYRKKLNDMIKEKYPEVNLNKTITDKTLLKKVLKYQEELKGIFPFEKNISIGRFENINGIVTDYYPQLNHYGQKSNWPKLEVWVDNNIKTYRDKIKQVKHLPANLKFQVEIGAMRFTEAKELAVEQYRQGIDKNRLSTTSDDLMSGEIANSGILSTRPQNWLAHTSGNLKSRSKNFMPYYDTTIKSLEIYLSSIYRNHVDVVRNIRIDNNIRRFEEAKPFGEFTPNWGMYMRDIAANIAGYPSLRNFEVHGIKQKEVSLIERYLESDLDFIKMGATPYEKRFLNDVKDQLGLTTLQQHNILQEIKQPGKEGSGPKLAKEQLKKNIKELLDKKNINKINRFGTAYQWFSDESMVNIVEKFNSVFGGNLLKNAPKDGRARQYYIASKVKNFSTLEGKYEMLSLLSHPKTAITNFYGGFTNTISDVGWDVFRKSNDVSWLLSNAFPNAEYFVTNSKTGKKERREIKSKEDIDRFLAELGVFEDMFIQEAYYSKKLGDINVKRFLNEVARRMNGKIKDGEISFAKETDYNRLQKKTLKEVAQQFNIPEAIWSKGAFFMRASEIKLRTTTWLANYIQGRKLFIEELGLDLAFNDPTLISYANKGVKASQFIYHAAERPNFSNTSLGRVMTRFHPYAWNSIKRRLDLYKGVTYEGWRGSLNTQKAQRQFTADIMALSLAQIFVGTIFEYALSPPMSWLQDTAGLIFGDEKTRDRAFFSQYPHPVLAPLSIVTPPIGRFVLSPLTSIINGNWDDFWNYQLMSYMPFGRLLRDGGRSFKAPMMSPYFMLGLPLHQLQGYSRKARNEWFGPEEDEDLG